MAASISPFAQLFKQSKFASFDRHIAQVYTTHGGNAHRGDWGFKRPLSIRRRGAYITVKNVDTTEYQTEWSSAEPQAVWMKNWDQLQISPQLSDGGHGSYASPEQLRDHIQESDYLPNQRDPSTWRRHYIPNLESMTPVEFRKYLDQIQAHRRKFYKVTQANQASKGRVTSSFYQLSNSYPTGWDDLYAQHLSTERRTNPRCRQIEHAPHRNGGLSYANYTPLQTFLMTKERKGRMVEEYIGKDNKKLFYVASFAGMGGIVQKHNAGIAQPMVWDDPRRTGEAMLRPQNVIVHRLPNVVGRVRQGLKAAKMDMELRVWNGQSHSRSNPHPPGSRQYIAAEPPGFTPGMTMNTTRKFTTRGKSRQSPSPGATIDVLNTILSREQS
ncbi:mitochondrial ribosomal protein subunit-domain-containing protein [Scleroderma citrinum]